MPARCAGLIAGVKGAVANLERVWGLRLLGPVTALSRVALSPTAAAKLLWGQLAAPIPWG
mgnify:CR=1 FL=1